MIFYFTKDTLKQYHLKLPHELPPETAKIAQTVIEQESGDRFLEWGAKLFWFNRRKCLQLVHFASKLTLVLVDFKKADMENLGDWIAHYLLFLYADNPETTALIHRYLSEAPVAAITQIKDRSIIATLNSTQLSFLLGGQRLWDYVHGSILNTHQLNYDLNFDWLITRKENDKTIWFKSGEYFEQMLKERYPSRLS